MTAQMTLALIHILLLLLLPAGLVLAIKGIKNKRWRLMQLSIATILLLVSLPAYPLCAYSLPFDWILDRPTVREVVQAGRYQVAFVQEPSADFYHVYFEVTGPGGGKERVPIEADAMRYWWVEKKRAGNRIYFLTGSKSTEVDAPFVDIGKQSVFSGTGLRNEEDLEGLFGGSE